uniref:Uncharacterized protein n=1 Tax=Anguilla anguilla TaxID=7936 RepID=A0A0E9PZZ2_ANGAN
MATIPPAFTVNVSRQAEARERARGVVGQTSILLLAQTPVGRSLFLLVVHSSVKLS